MASPPNTRAQLSHAMVIRTTGANAKVIGAINEWNPRINRTLTDLYEFGEVSGINAGQATGPGQPFEIAPGNVSGMQIDVRRWDLYTEQMESAFGTPGAAMEMLGQLDAVAVREAWASNNLPTNYYRAYAGCWFQDVGRTLDAKGDRTVNVSATIRFTKRTRGESTRGAS